MKSDLDLYTSLGNEFESRSDLAASIEARVRGISALPLSAESETDQVRARIGRFRRFQYAGFSLYVLGTLVTALTVVSQVGRSTEEMNAASLGVAGAGLVAAALGLAIYVRSGAARRRAEVGPPDLVRIFEDALRDDDSSNGGTT
ncbi:hypothetical protein CH295_22925 [Rhodococcus sp. 14-2483-1-2]|nr:hypothetical protein CH295_22925 [Rhodococcus sp. 14-2483-1-2]